MSEHKNFEEEYEYQQGRAGLAVLGGCAVGGVFQAATEMPDLPSVGVAVAGGILLYKLAEPIHGFLSRIR